MLLTDTTNYCMFSFFGATVCALGGMIICYFLNYTPVLGIILGLPLGFLSIDLFIRSERRKFFTNIYYYLNHPDDYPGLTEALFGLMGALTRGSVYRGYHKSLNLYKAVLNLSPQESRRADRFFLLGAAGKLSIPELLHSLFTLGSLCAHIPLLAYEMSLQLLLRKGSLSEAELRDLTEIASYFGLSDKECRRLIKKRTAQICTTVSAEDREIDKDYCAFDRASRQENTYANDSSRDGMSDIGSIPHEVLAAFSLLQLRYDATLEEVKAAYKKLRFKLHPDRHPQANNQEKARLNAELIRIQNAYATLSAYLQAAA